MRNFLLHLIKSKALLVLLVLLALYALLGFFLAPYLVVRYLPAYVQDRLHARATIAAVRINPFLLTLDARGFSLKASDGRPIVSFDRLFIDLSLSSLVHRAWTFQTVALDRPDLTLAVDSAGRLNLAELARSKAPGATHLPPFAIAHAQVSNAQVRYTDESHAPAASVTVGPIDLSAAHISTALDAKGSYSYRVKLPGDAALDGQGSLSLQPLSSQGEIQLTQLKLSTAWPFLHGKRNLVAPQGALSVHGRYRFSNANAAPLLALSDVDARLDSLVLARSGEKQPLLTLHSVLATGGSYDSKSGEIVLPALMIDGGGVSATRDAHGNLDWTHLTPAGKPSQSAHARWGLRIGAITIHKLALRYTDEGHRVPVVANVGRADATLALDVAAHGGAAHATARDIRVQLAHLALTQAGAPTPLATLNSVVAYGGNVDTVRRSIAVGRVVLSGGNLPLVRDAHGRFLLAAALASRIPSRAPATSQRSNVRTAWTYRIDRAQLERTRITLIDRGYDPALEDQIGVESLALEHVDSASRSPISFSASLKVASGGTVRAKGNAAQGFSAAKARIDVAGLSVLPLRTVLAKGTMLDLRAGTLSGSATVDYARKSKPMLRAAGHLKLAQFKVDDARSAQRLIAWRSLAANRIAFTLAPDRLDVMDAELDRPEATIAISRERKLNLAEVLKGKAPIAHAKARGNTTHAVKPAAKKAVFPVRIGRLRVRDGVVDYSDASLVLPFSTHITRLNGSVAGIATAAGARAELKLGGRIGSAGYASADGGVDLLAPMAFTDIDVKFSNVDMPPLSPYTATFAGRKIAGGRMWLDLDYKIIKQQLAGENKVLLKDLKLGARVKSPTALDLPLDLAIALLTDPEGRISIAIPVRGDVGKPKFDYGTVIRKAVATALGRIVTAPFRALASLFGGETPENLGKVGFAPGSARLFPPQRERLLKLVAALNARPQLDIVVHSAYDPKRDAASMRDDRVRRDLARVMHVSLKPGESPGPVAYSDPVTQRALEALFAAREGEAALGTFAKDYARQHGKQPGARRAYYQALFEALVVREPLPDDALRALAVHRSEAIAAVLRQAGLAASRITSGAPISVEGSAESMIEAQLKLTAR